MLIGAGLVAAVAEVRRGNVPDPRIGVGVYIGGILLLIVSSKAPAAASGIAATTFATSLALYGPDVAGGITAATGARRSPSPTATGTDSFPGGRLPAGG